MKLFHEIIIRIITDLNKNSLSFVDYQYLNIITNYIYEYGFKIILRRISNEKNYFVWILLQHVDKIKHAKTYILKIMIKVKEKS